MAGKQASRDGDERDTKRWFEHSRRNSVSRELAANKLRRVLSLNFFMVADAINRFLLSRPGRNFVI